MILAVLNMLLFLKYGTLSFGRCAFMTDFGESNYLLPLVTSMTGIFFWLKISKFIEPILGENRLVNYISDNTFFIMMHHLAFVNLFSALLLQGKNVGISAFADFDIALFVTNPWYTFGNTAWLRAAYFLFCISATLMVCKLWGAFVERIKAVWEYSGI